MAVVVRYWAGAKRAAGTESETLDVATVGALRALLRARPALAAVADAAAMLVDGRHAADDVALVAGSEVDVLPPFAGG